MKNNKVLGLLGLATRAGKVQSGEFSTDKAVKAGKAALVLVSKDSSENTRKQFKNQCAYYKVPYFEFGDKEELGRAMGKEMRASLAVVDAGFADAIVKLLCADSNSECEGE